jgi:hypothetical protein
MRTSPKSLPPYRQTTDSVSAALQMNPGQGLSEAEARSRLLRDGRDELIAEKPVTKLITRARARRSRAFVRD